jgi:hypothetical protein
MIGAWRRLLPTPRTLAASLGALAVTGHHEGCGSGAA